MSRPAAWLATLVGVGAMVLVATFTRADPVPVTMALVFLGGALARALTAFAAALLGGGPAAQDLVRDLAGGIVMAAVAAGAALAVRQWIGPPPPPLVPAVGWLVFEAVLFPGRRQPT